MPRTVDSATQTVLESGAFRMCHLLQIDFSESLYITDSDYAVSYDGETYLPAGHLLQISGSSETQDLRVGTMSIELSGVNQQYVAILLNQAYINRKVQIYLAILDASGAVTGDAIKTFEGIIDSFSLNDRETSSSISLKVSSHWSDFERKSGRLTNNNSQQYFFSADTGMRFAAESIRDIKWGKS